MLRLPPPHVPPKRNPGSAQRRKGFERVACADLSIYTPAWRPHSRLCDWRADWKATDQAGDKKSAKRGSGECAPSPPHRRRRWAMGMHRLMLRGRARP
eukprot:scaffold1639_cov125-Isochrysis_galbana.AAC.1